MIKDVLLAPSLLASDFGNLAGAVKTIENGGGDWVHIDVMDGSFVPNITIGQPVVESLRPLTKLVFDVHLMIDHPENHIESFIKVGADYLTFHYENTVHHHSIFEKIRSCGAKCGISIVPSTPIHILSEILPFADLVLVMTVNPGFGGQKLIPRCVQKISELKALRAECGYSYKISVDGGVNEKTLPLVIDAGADVVVSGSAFFSGALKWEK